MSYTDIYHITVAGFNPHKLSAEIWREKGNPFYSRVGNGSVAQDIIVDGKPVGGIVEVWGPEHLTPEQEKWLQDRPYIIDVRHVWPEN